MYIGHVGINNINNHNNSNLRKQQQKFKINGNLGQQHCILVYQQKIKVNGNLLGGQLDCVIVYQQKLKVHRNLGQWSTTLYFCYFFVLNDSQNIEYNSN